MASTKERIRNVMGSVFEVSLNDINEQSSTDNVDNWDSVRHLNLILALEEEFNISIPDEEVGSLVNFKIIELVVNECSK